MNIKDGIDDQERSDEIALYIEANLQARANEARLIAAAELRERRERELRSFRTESTFANFYYGMRTGQPHPRVWFCPVGANSTR